MFVSGAGKCRCDVDAALDSAMLGRAAAVLADEADRVAVVDHHHGVVLLRQVADAGQIGDDAVHPEDPLVAIRRKRASVEPSLEVGHLVVGIAETVKL